MGRNIEFAIVLSATKAMREAIAVAEDDLTREALRKGLEVLETLAAERADPASRYDGYIETTIEDDVGRSIDVRVFYDWSDYDPRDEPHAEWGAVVGEIQILGLSHVDCSGNEVTLSEHALEVVYRRMQEEHGIFYDRCTEDGYRRGLGEAPFFYSPYTAPTDRSSPEFSSRMAGSLPTRLQSESRRQSG